ncbi:MAG TPA: hypothetical protein VFR02_08270, partial [bacterium]|nr:hypothetical protein [bacterium]
MKLSVKFSAFVLTAAMLGFAGQADAQGWVLQLGGGVSEPLSKQLYSNYSLGYNASMALGYKVGGDLVLSVVTQADSLGLKQLSDIDNGQLPYDSSHPTTKSASFDSLQVSGIAKLYLGGVAALRPYVFGGPGVAFNDYHIHTDFPGNGSSFQSDFDTLETDFFATAGLGAELD